MCHCVKVWTQISKVGSELEPLFTKLLCAQGIFKVCKNSNKVIAEYGHTALLSILTRQSTSIRNLRLISKELDSKNASWRYKICQYFLLVMLTSDYITADLLEVTELAL